MTTRLLDLLYNKKVILARIHHLLIKSAKEYLDNRGFTDVSTIVPHITTASGACENFSTVFEIDYFNQKAYLAQTEQLYLELLVPSFGRVWCVGPSFRAEPKVDSRHLTEFPLLEYELSGDFEQLLNHAQNLILEMVNGILSRNEKELDLMGVAKDRLESIEKPFQRITYEGAIGILGLEWGSDLSSQQEKLLVEIHGNQPLFITHFPKEVKFFNMKNNSKDPRVVNSVDLLLPFSGEAVGGAEREYEYAVVLEKLQESSILRQLREREGNIGDFDFYLGYLRRYGSMPHSGAGIGLNRVVQFICGLDDIRSSTIFPLYKGNLM